MSDETDLIERLRHADQHSVQRMNGSRIFGEAADAILKLQGGVAEARETIQRLVTAGNDDVTLMLDTATTLKAATARADAAEAEVSRIRGELDAAREALKPFAALADDYLADTVNFDDDTIMAGRIVRRRDDPGTPPRVTFADFRKARAALTERTT